MDQHSQIQNLFTHHLVKDFVEDDAALLYVDEDDLCDELKEKLREHNIKFIEWKVKREDISSPLPLLITGSGVYTEKQILFYDKYLPKVLQCS